MGTVDRGVNALDHQPVVARFQVFAALALFCVAGWAVALWVIRSPMQRSFPDRRAIDDAGATVGWELVGIGPSSMWNGSMCANVAMPR
jgi:hypothetical protein